MGPGRRAPPRQVAPGCTLLREVQPARPGGVLEVPSTLVDMAETQWWRGF